MTSSFWCLHCKHQTQSTPCFSAFNANPEHETTVLVYLYIYIHRNARPVDENEDNWTVTMALGFIVFVIKLKQTSLTSSSYIFITDLEEVNIFIEKYIIENHRFYIANVKITMKLQLQHSTMISTFSFLKLFSIWLNISIFSLGKWNKFLLPDRKNYIHLNWQIHTF